MKLYRKVIRIRAEDSPNVRLALAQQRAGRQPTGEIVIPGVLPWADYVQRRATWDAVKQCVGLDAQFYEGAAQLLFPPEWLNRAELVAELLAGTVRRAEGIGVDPGEGYANTSFAVVDRLGLMDLVSIKTVDTSVIVPRCIELIRRYGLPAERVCLDRGGGGKQIADELRRRGYPVRTVGFGETVMQEPRPGVITPRRRLQGREERYPYRSRRAEMYGRLRQLVVATAGDLGGAVGTGGDEEVVDPRGGGFTPFALPARYGNLRKELAPIPLLYDGEGRMYLPSKTSRGRKAGDKTLVELIGHSPDEADALVLAVHAMASAAGRVVVGGGRPAGASRPGAKDEKYRTRVGGPRASYS